jgi:hypothetical protein
VLWNSVTKQLNSCFTIHFVPGKGYDLRIEVLCPATMLLGQTAKKRMGSAERLMKALYA